MTRVLCISGSPAEGSHTLTLLQTVGDMVQALGAEVELWDLLAQPLPFSQPSWHKDPLSSGAQAVCDFYGAVIKADAVVLATPLYHGSYSGLLKNALDCLTGDAFKGKRVGLVSHGSNIRKSHQPCIHLTTVIMAMEGTPVHTQVGTGKTDYEQAKEGLKLVEPDVLARCKQLAEELVKG